MASRRIGVTAVSGDILANEEIRDVNGPSILNVWASSVTNGDELGVHLDRLIIMPAGEVNTIAGDIIDVSMDQLIFNTVLGRGTLRAPVPTLTTELQALFSVEPLA